MMAHKILDYWFPKETFQKWWFQKSQNVDDYISTNFLPILEEVKNNGFDQWLQTPTSFVALIILLDQMTRHIYRGTELSNSNDQLALSLTYQFIQSKYDYMVPINYLVFALMPLRHSKNISDRLLVLSKINEYESYWQKNGKQLNDQEKDIWSRFIRASQIKLNCN